MFKYSFPKMKNLRKPKAFRNQSDQGDEFGFIIRPQYNLEFQHDVANCSMVCKIAQDIVSLSK